MTYVVKRRNSDLNNGLNIMNDFDKVFSNLYSGISRRMNSANSPAANVWEDQESYQVELLVPGYSQEQLEIELKDNLLTIKTDKKNNDASRKNEYHLQEFSTEGFSRSFVLPRNAEQENIQARYENGILTLSITKIPEAKPKQIKINS